MAPEYMMRGNYSVKSDAFSFGVMVLEIVTGTKNNDNASWQSEDLLNTVFFPLCHLKKMRAMLSISPSTDPYGLRSLYLNVY